MKKAVILLSGGLDSTTCLAIARAQGFECYALSFDYGQRHNAELVAAKRIAIDLSVADHRIVKLDIAQFGGSALTDKCLEVPDFQQTNAIPITYVPARNTVFLSIALAYAESIGATDIFIGVSAVDYSGYPDCRAEFIAAFQHLANVATKIGSEGGNVVIHAPLQHLSKAETILAGVEYGLDFQRTVSCYQATKNGLACGCCDSCVLRQQGFLAAGIEDPTHYQRNK